MKDACVPWTDVDRGRLGNVATCCLYENTFVRSPHGGETRRRDVVSEFVPGETSHPVRKDQDGI